MKKRKKRTTISRCVLQRRHTSVTFEAKPQQQTAAPSARDHPKSQITKPERIDE